jgi:hypothetical protein
LKAKLPIIEFDEHEVIILVVADFTGRTFEVHAAPADLSACASDEIVDAVLRFRALVDVIVAGEGDIDLVALKERLKQSPQL